MKNLLGFLIVNGVFAMASSIAAAIVWAAGNALLAFAPQQADNPFAWYGIGAVALGASIGFVVATVRLAQLGAKS